MKKTRALFLLSLLFAAGCNQVPRAAYFNHGAPESLLDVSSEVVTVNFGANGGMDELTGWVNKDLPSRADLFCVEGDPACMRAKQVLSQFNVSFHQMPEPRNTAALYYERVMARDCEHRFIDNSINPYNLPSPTSGCSIAANMVQMVSDKREFVNPALLDFVDGEKAVQAYRAYEMPSAPATSIQSSIQGSSPLSGSGSSPSSGSPTAPQY
ncbi:MAG: hypothetical protein JO089_02670 [Alphaproteobacteria bacterium]|nr:hypothetical protein [Alphaproteobacteria bacterium]